MSVREIRRDGRTISFEASYKRGGRKYRKRWKTRNAAEQWLRDQQADRLISISLSGPQKLDAARALAILQPMGVTLETAATRYQHLSQAGNACNGSWTFREACNAVLQARRDMNVRQNYLDHLRRSLNLFCLEFGARKLDDITTDALMRYVRSRGDLKPQTRANYRLELGQVFNYAIRHGRCNRNPAKLMPKPKMEDRPVPILRVAEVRKLLSVTDSLTGMYCGLGLFCGIRPFEIAKIRINSINTASNTIEVAGPNSKSRQRRFCTIPQNLVCWLEPALEELSPDKDYRHIRSMINLAASKSGVLLAPDIFRHSFASHHLALHCNPALTSHEMGHRNQDMLYRHYRDLVTKEEAQEYFAIAK